MQTLMARYRAHLILLVIFFIIITCNLFSENARADNAHKNVNLTPGILCDTVLVSENKGEREDIYLNVSYTCQNINTIFSIPNYTMNYILKGAVNEEGVLHLTVTPDKGISILVIAIRLSDKPFYNAQEYKKINLYNYLQDFYPISTSLPYYKQIDSCNGTIMNGKTEDVRRPWVAAATYDQSFEREKIFMRVYIKSAMNENEFDELLNSFKLRTRDATRNT